MPWVSNDSNLFLSYPHSGISPAQIPDDREIQGDRVRPGLDCPICACAAAIPDQCLGHHPLPTPPLLSPRSWTHQRSPAGDEPIGQPERLQDGLDILNGKAGSSANESLHGRQGHA